MPKTILVLAGLMAVTSAQAGTGRPAAPASRVEAAVPARFQGEWNTVVRECGSALNDSRLVIGANSIRYHESSGPLRAIVTAGAHELALISELSGEGERWLGLARFRLDATQKKLIDVTDAAHPLVRHRCPASWAGR